jgi:hypothetical protein
MQHNEIFSIYSPHFHLPFLQLSCVRIFSFSTNSETVNHYMIFEILTAKSMKIAGREYRVDVGRRFGEACCSRQWGENTSLNCCHQRAYYSSPRWYMTMERHVVMKLTEETRNARRISCPSSTFSTLNLSNRLNVEQTRTSALRYRWLTAWAIVRSCEKLLPLSSSLIALMMAAVRPSHTLVNVYQTTRYYISQDSHFYNETLYYQ